MIELKNFNIALGKKHVVDNITASFSGNNVIIGPNGAGKTMLLKGMLGLVDYTGNCEINGNKSRYIKNIVDISFNLPEIYRLARNVKDIITIYSGLKGKDVSAVYTVLDEFNLSGILDKNIDELSTGQEKLLCNILAALATNKRLTFTQLLNLTGGGKGSLNNNLSKLEEGKLIKFQNAFTLKGPRLFVTITDDGLKMYRTYINLIRTFDRSLK